MGDGDAGRITIKKYANRRLYNTASSSYVTLDDLSAMVREGVELSVVDAKTGEDITRTVLAQIIFEKETQGEAMLPVTFLQQLIRLYGDSLQNVVPQYLDMSMLALLRQQEQFREGVTEAIGRGSLDMFEEQAKRNVELFDQALRMFSGQRAEKHAVKTGDADELADLKAQVRDLSARLDALAKTPPEKN